MIRHESQVRVRYQETDAMGIVYHGNYLTWFELARVEMLDAMGLPYKELEAQGYLLPVLEAYAAYLAPARFDERIRIVCKIEEMPRVRVRINYEVFCDEKRLTHGYTVHAFMDKKGAAVKPPESFLKIIAEHLTPKA